MILKMAIRNLVRNKRRSFAILITIAMGVGALFLYHGFNTGMMNQYKFNTVHSRYGHGQLNTKGYREKVFEKPWEHWIDNYDVVEKFLRANENIAYVFPRVEFYGLLSNGKVNISGKGQGIVGEEESKFFTALNIIEGKDLADVPDGILLGKGLARALDASINSRVTILANTINGSLNGIDLNVVGIFNTGIREFDDNVFRIPLKQAHILLDTNKIENISLGLKNDESWNLFSRNVMNHYSNLEAVSFAELDEVYYQHGTNFLRAQFDMIRIIILVIVILGIFNTVLTSVLERKQEIGNLRANGESPIDILKLLFAEGIVIGVIGGIIGLVGATLLNKFFLFNGITMPASPGLTKDLHVMIELQPDYALVTFALGIITALVGTYLAGRRVTQLGIGELLKSL